MRSLLINGATGILRAAMLLVTATADAQNREAVADLSVRVFDLTGQRDDQRQVALQTAAEILATAGVHTAWTVCGPAGTCDPDCSNPLRNRDRLVRLMPTSPAWSRLEGAALGAAVVDRRARSGVLATVYADRVSWMASRAAVDPAVLMGRAMAHELGHLLIGGRHATAGIMRRSWTVNDLRRDRPGDWQFTKDQMLAVRTVGSTSFSPALPSHQAEPWDRSSRTACVAANLPAAR